MAEPEEERPLAWLAIRPHTPVHTSDGVHVGNIDEVLGSQATDIFHGIVVTSGTFEHESMIPAEYVASITNKVIEISLTMEEVRGLPPYVGEESHRLGFVGLLRQGLGWVEDKSNGG